MMLRGGMKPPKTIIHIWLLILLTLLPLAASADSIPPIISTLSDGAVTANPVLNIAGQVPPGSSWASITVNGVSVKVDADGNFSHTIRLITGANTVIITATDQ